MAAKTKEQQIAMKIWKIGGSLVVIVVLGLILFGKKGESGSATKSDTQVEAENKICWQCGQHLDIGEGIMTNPDKYLCLLCYQKTQREIKEELSAEGYDVK